MKRISKELMGASSIPIILSILEHGDSYGYEIMQKVRTLSKGTIEWKEGSIYPVLKKLENTGLIESYWNVEGVQRPRKYYAIKKDGKKQLQREIEEWTCINNLFGVLWDKQISSS
jgi:PadR family transcriptional regulator, regulatory protein PadR